MEKNITKTILIMSVRTFLAAFICCVFVSVLSARNTSAQSIKEVVISVDFNGASLSHVFNNIEEKTEFTFLYDKAKITSNSRRVTLRKERVTVAKILQQISRQTGVTFRQVNNSIAVHCPEATAIKNDRQTGTIKGEVTDARTGETLPGANVYLKGDATIGATTDKEGNYTINNVEAGSHTLVASFVGYKRSMKRINLTEGSTIHVLFELQASTMKLGETQVTTGTVVPTEVKKLPNPINVVTAKEIEQMNPDDVGDVFRLAVPNAVYTDEGVGTTYGTLSVRGVSSIQGAASTLKIYVDGVEVSDPAYITYMDPTQIERIEVTSGPQASTIYGSRAISGVIQIFTKKGARGNRPTISGKVALKTVDERYVDDRPFGEEFALNANGGSESLSYHLGANLENEPQWIDLFQQQTLNLSGGTNFKQGKWEGGLSIQYSRLNNISGWDPIEKQSTESLGLPPDPPNGAGRNTFQTYGLNLQYHATENWTHNFKAGYNSLRGYNYDRAPGPDSLYFVSARNTQRYTLSYNTSLVAPISDSFSITTTAGADYSYYSLPFFSGNIPDRTDYELTTDESNKVKNFGFFGQTQVGYKEALFLTVGIRADKRPKGANDTFTYSPRAGLSFVHDFQDWTAKARFSYGQAVIIPDEQQIVGSESQQSIVKPNPDLKSEIQRGYDLGVNLYYSNKLSFGITYFNQKPQNLINLTNTGTDGQGRTVYQYQNLNEVQNRGIEIKGTVRPAHWLKVTANYGYTKSTVEKVGPDYSDAYEIGDEIPGQPKYTLSTQVVLTPIEGTSFTIGGFRYGSFKAADFAEFLRDLDGGTYDPSQKAYPNDYQITYPAFNKIYINFSQSVTDRLTGFLHIDNVTNNDDFERLNTIVSQPRTITFGIRLSGLRF